jgi:hypothetical protein
MKIDQIYMPLTSYTKKKHMWKEWDCKVSKT